MENYGAETQGMKEKITVFRYVVIQMECLRSMCGETKLDQIDNEDKTRVTEWLEGFEVLDILSLGVRSA